MHLINLNMKCTLPCMPNFQISDPLLLPTPLLGAGSQVRFHRERKKKKKLIRTTRGVISTPVLKRGTRFGSDFCPILKTAHHSKYPEPRSGSNFCPILKTAHHSKYPKSKPLILSYPTIQVLAEHMDEW